jgi:hypothetical protein
MRYNYRAAIPGSLFCLPNRGRPQDLLRLTAEGGPIVCDISIKGCSNIFMNLDCQAQN